MTPFTRITAVAAPLLRDNVDTDAIIPSREIRTVSRTGLQDGLFAGWRYRGPGREADPEFVLNQPAYAQTRILLGGDNFGCGSSREHAVWALHEYGIRAIFAPSFAPIFFGNCVGNGLLPGRMPLATLQGLAAAIAADPANHPLTVDLEAASVSCPGAGTFRFDIEDDARDMLLLGLDRIDQTLRSLEDIEAFQLRDRDARPWVYS